MIGLRDDLDTPPPPPARAPGLTARTFAAGGWLQAALHLDHRPQQEEMARGVARAFADDAPLLFEAGTGVGKSLAYLVPGILHAVDQSRQLIVSTHTIALQEQLKESDLPKCRRLFRETPELAPYADFRATVLVGKANYLCPTRLALALAERATLLADADYDELRRIAAWAETTHTGRRDELDPPPRPEVWDLVSADSSACSRKHCEGGRCFYQEARVQLRQAQVVIVNHALLFSLLRAGGAQADGAPEDARGVLFADDFVVLDEAHTVPEVATNHFGISLSSHGVDRALKSLHNPRTRRGLLRRLGDATGPALVGETLEAARTFFESLAATLLAERPLVRLRAPDPVAAELDAPLAALQRHLATLGDRLPDGRDRDELLDQRQRLKALQATFGEWLALGDPAHVYWAERTGRERTWVTLRSAPLEIAPALRRHLFGCGTAVVCTSATLALGGQVGAFAARLGAGDARTGLVRSPFDYARHMRVFVAGDIPLPAATDARLALDSLADYVAFCTRRVRGGSLVLFTSHADLRAVAQRLEPVLQAEGRPLLWQGAGGPRTELARRMREHGNAVLLGTDTFWTGIDIPGDALAQVVITRLPFEPPDHPVTEARSDHIRDQGGQPFQELALPDALMKFRQGAGRLIRSASDRGVITILDARVLAKTYGRLFLDSLPQPAFTVLSRENREEKFRPFA